MEILNEKYAATNLKYLTNRIIVLFNVWTLNTLFKQVEPNHWKKQLKTGKNFPFFLINLTKRSIFRCSCFGPLNKIIGPITVLYSKSFNSSTKNKKFLSKMNIENLLCDSNDDDSRKKKLIYSLKIPFHCKLQNQT